MRKRDRHREGAGGRWLCVVYELFKAGIFAGVSMVLMLLACSFLISSGIFRDGWSDGAVMGVCVWGGLIGGICAVRKIRKQQLLVGLTAGVILFLLLFTAGAFAYGERAGGSAGGIFAACLCGGGIAGILSSKPGKRRKR